MVVLLQIGTPREISLENGLDARTLSAVDAMFPFKVKFVKMSDMNA